MLARASAVPTPRIAVRRTELAVALLTVATAAAGFLRLGARSIWLDEAVAVRYAARSFRGLQGEIAGDPNMSLYYELLWAWRRVFGESELALRSLSVLFGALTVPVVFRLGEQLFDRRVGLVAALLTATNPFFLLYAQEARSYSLAAFLVSLSCWFFVRELSDPGLGNRVGLVASSVLAFYAHFFAAYVIVAQVVALLVLEGRRAFRRSWGLSYLAVVLLVAPVCYLAFRLQDDRDPIGWIGPTTWSRFTDTMHELAGDSFSTLGAVLAVLLLAAPKVARSRRLRRGLVLPAAWLVTPVVLAFAVSYAKHMFLAKYLIVCLPALALVTAACLLSLRPRAEGPVLLVVLLLFAAHPLWTWYERPGRENWRDAARLVAARARPGDGVVYQTWVGRSPFSYYLRRLEAPSLTVIRSGGDGSTLGRTSLGRVWLVLYQTGDVGRRMETSLRRHGFDRAARGRFSTDAADITVELFTRS